MRRPIMVVVVMVIVCLVGGLLVIAVPKVREAAVRSQCSNNLRIIGVAVHNYGSGGLEHFPQASEPNPNLALEHRLSWLATLGPSFEATNLYARMDREKGWDAEENRYLALTAYRLLRCPNDTDRPPESTLIPTNYVGIAGLGADAATLPLDDPRAGFFGYERILRPADIKDHQSGLLIALETIRTSGAWTAAGPPTVRGLEENGSPYLSDNGPFGGTHTDGANALFADASVRFLRNTMDSQVLSKIAAIHGSDGTGHADRE